MRVTTVINDFTVGTINLARNKTKQSFSDLNFLFNALLFAK